MPQYKVLRPHEGDRWYNEGDIRDGSENDLKHLVGKVLEPVAGVEEKAEQPLENKQAPAPQNKAEPDDKESKPGSKKNKSA